MIKSAKGIGKIFIQSKNKFSLNKFFSDEVYNKKFQINQNVGEVENYKQNTTDNQVSINDFYNIKKRKIGRPDPEKSFDIGKFKHNNYHIGVFDKEKFAEVDDELKIPVSPRLAPYEIINPHLGTKTYHWCSCGMSKSQPFCDRSHYGTRFKPISFKLAEKCDRMLLCGCKLSKTAPFCDSKTCVSLKKKEEEEIENLTKE